MLIKTHSLITNTDIVFVLNFCLFSPYLENIDSSISDFNVSFFFKELMKIKINMVQEFTSNTFTTFVLKGSDGKFYHTKRSDSHS